MCGSTEYNLLNISAMYSKYKGLKVNKKNQEILILIDYRIRNPAEKILFF